MQPQFGMRDARDAGRSRHLTSMRTARRRHVGASDMFLEDIREAANVARRKIDRCYKHVDLNGAERLERRRGRHIGYWDWD